MSYYGKLLTLVMCLNQLLASKIHSNFNLRDKNTIFFVVVVAILLISIFLHVINLHCIILLQL